MTLAVVLLSATKLAGVLGAITLAANAISYSRYRKRNLRNFQSPIDESAEVLADFYGFTEKGNKRQNYLLIFELDLFSYNFIVF